MFCNKKLLVFIFLLGINPLFSQKDTIPYYNKTLKKNNFSIEVGGKAGYYSLGYERTVFNSKKFLISGSIAFSYGTWGRWNLLIIPVGVNILVGKKQNKFLFGLHETNGFDFKPYPKTQKERQMLRDTGQISDSNYRPLYQLPGIFISIGYRRYFRKGNSFSIAFTPLMRISDNGVYNLHHPNFAPWFGVNYNFKF